MKFLLIGLAVGCLLGAVSQAGAQTVKIDGSSTVFPITEAVAEEFQKAKKGKIRVTVGISGTGGGSAGGETPAKSERGSRSRVARFRSCWATESSYSNRSSGTWRSCSRCPSCRLRNGRARRSARAASRLDSPCGLSPLHSCSPQSRWS